MSPLNTFLLGALSMGFFVAGAFFLRFWRQTRDALFLLFAIAFWVESASRAMFAFIARPDESRPLFYAVRTLAYGLILGGIIAKNLPRRSAER